MIMLLWLDSHIAEDRQACIDHSIALGYLSLEEGDEMIKAHVTTLYHLGKPFASDVFDFGSQVCIPPSLTHP